MPVFFNIRYMIIYAIISEYVAIESSLHTKLKSSELYQMTALEAEERRVILNGTCYHYRNVQKSL